MHSRPRFSTEAAHIISENRARCFPFLSGPCREFDTRRPSRCPEPEPRRRARTRKKKNRAERGKGRKRDKGRTDHLEFVSNREKYFGSPTITSRAFLEDLRYHICPLKSYCKMLCVREISVKWLVATFVGDASRAAEEPSSRARRRFN